MDAARLDVSGIARPQRAFLRELGGGSGGRSVDPAGLFRRPPHGTVADRWHVYAHGYIARLREALSLEYAAIARIVGPDTFSDLVRRYVAVFPPRSFDLARAGDRLERFLEFDSLTRELPFLPALARLESAAAACFTAADAKPVDWNTLGVLDPEDIARLPLRLAPGVALIESAWPLVDLWNVRFDDEQDDVSIPLYGRAQSALVWRHAERVRVAAISAEEASLVATAGIGTLTLEDLGELSGSPAEADSVEALLIAFRSLVERGVFAHPRSSGWTGALETSKEES